MRARYCITFEGWNIGAVSVKRVRLSDDGVVCADVHRHGGDPAYQHVKVFISYYHQTRTHLSLAKDTPETRAVQPTEKTLANELSI